MTDTPDIKALVAHGRKFADIAAEDEFHYPPVLREEIRTLANALERTQAVVEAARLFCKEGTILTYCDGIVQKVIEHADRSDPQSKLFEALAALDAQAVLPQQGASKEKPKP